MPPSHVKRFKNRLLAAFCRNAVEHIYFIEEGLASVLTGMSDGSTIVVGMIGVEGMVGVSALLGGGTSARQIIAQMPGTALRMSTAQCKTAFEQSAAVRLAVHRFTDAFLNLSAQTAACNRLHSIEQRCARWLLMSSDRVGSSNDMPMTHEFMSSMLGVRRAGVTTTLGEFSTLRANPKWSRTARVLKRPHASATRLITIGLKACSETGRTVNASLKNGDGITIFSMMNQNDPYRNFSDCDTGDYYDKCLVVGVFIMG